METKKIKKKVIDKIIEGACIMAERAYRRGFQHGVNCVPMGITDKDASKFRFHVSLKRAWGAPEVAANLKLYNPWRNIRHSLRERHYEMENSSELKSALELLNAHASENW